MATHTHTREKKSVMCDVCESSIKGPSNSICVTCGLAICDVQERGGGLGVGRSHDSAVNLSLFAPCMRLWGFLGSSGPCATPGGMSAAYTEQQIDYASIFQTCESLAYM